MLANAVERITIVAMGKREAEHPGDKVINVPVTVSLAGATHEHVITVALENDRWQLMRTSEQLSGDVTVSSDVGDYLTIGSVRTDLADSETRDATLWPQRTMSSYMLAYTPSNGPNLHGMTRTRNRALSPCSPAC